MVALRGSTRVPPYQLSPHDEDLQDIPPSTGFSARGKEGGAKTRALIKLNAAMGNIEPLVTMADFEVTRTARGELGPYSPVEWQCTRILGNGDRQRTWTLVIDMDDIPAGAGGAGPDRPHVGYSYWCSGYNPVGRVNGHIFIEYVSASR